MKILFTGANGFLGKNVIPSLRKKSFEVKTFGTHDTDYVNDITKEITPFEEKFDIIFHAAGKAHSIPSNTEEETEFYDVNFTGTKRICRALENKLPKIFIFISSVAVYGIDSGVELTEQTPLNGTTPYAKSKLLSESFLEEWCLINNVILTILRPSLIAGPNPPGNLGNMINSLKKGFYFNIAGGTAKKSVVWAEDFAEIISLVSAGKGGVYNVTDGVHPTFAEIAKKISSKFNSKNTLNMPLFVAKGIAVIGDLLGKRFPFNSLKLKKMTEELTFSNDKIIKNLGWKPTNVIEKL